AIVCDSFTLEERRLIHTRIQKAVPATTVIFLANSGDNNAQILVSAVRMDPESSYTGKSTRENTVCGALIVIVFTEAGSFRHRFPLLARNCLDSVQIGRAFPFSIG